MQLPAFTCNHASVTFKGIDQDSEDKEDTYHPTQQDQRIPSRARQLSCSAV